MQRFRFATGLTLGLVIGLVVGALLALSMAPSSGKSPDRLAEIQLQELTRKLDAAREARERADRQIDQFTKLAEQMTASFQSLEARFKGMEAELQRRQQADPKAGEVAPAPPAAP